MFLQQPQFYLLRTPAKPFINLRDIVELTPHEALKKLAEDKLFMEGIFIASQDLYNSYQKYLANDDISSDNLERLFTTVYKYLTRYSSKTIPFGLFAGYSYGYFSERERVLINKPGKHLAVTRLDMSYIVEICDYLNRIPQIRNQLKYYVNNTSYVLNNKFYYIESIIENFTKKYHFTSIDNSEYLDKIIEICKEGAGLQEIASYLIVQGFPDDIAIGYCTELIDNQILLSELEPTIIGLNNLDKLISVISPFEKIDSIKDILADMRNVLRSDKNIILKSQEVQDLLTTIVPVEDKKNLIQLDLQIKTRENTIKSETVQHFLPELERIFLALSAPYKNPRLDDFKHRFVERYGDNEMPLSQVLDPVHGLLYDPGSGADELNQSVHIKDLPQTAPVEEYQTGDALSQLRLKKLTEALQSGSAVASITSEELKELRQDISYSKLPDSYYIMGTLLLDKANGIVGTKLYLQNFIGSSGMNLINRFTPTSSAIKRIIKNFIKKEQSFNKDSIYAEIAHLPQPRVGNVLLRTATRNFEIPYLAASNLPSHQQILFNDLLVSIRQGKVIIRSIKHNVEVIPRLTTAHIYRTGLTVYKFLGDLQKQDVYDYNNWSWRELSEQDFLPRIESNGIILSPARWKIYKKITVTDRSFEEFRDSLNQISPKLPSLLLLIENDHELLIDLENKHSLNIFKNMLSKSVSLEIRECLQNENNALAYSATGWHFHELIIPFHKILPLETDKKRSPGKPISHSLPIPSTFILGSEWLFLKIYSSEARVDIILAALKPYLEKWISFGIIDKWFFLRYSDPNFHLRIRLHGCTPHFYDQIIREMNEVIDPMVKSGEVANLVTDNYVREIGRYGALNISSFEEVSYHDSCTTLDILHLIKRNRLDDIRWLLILKSIDVLLNDFGFCISQKLDYVKQYKLGLFREIRANNDLNKILNIQYREREQQIRAFLELQNEPMRAVKIFNGLLRKRSSKLKKHLKVIIKNEKKTNQFYQKSIHFGIVHLSINRLCVSEPRQHELVFYHYLEVFYTTQINKLKFKSKNASTNARSTEPIQ